MNAAHGPCQPSLSLKNGKGESRGSLQSSLIFTARLLKESTWQPYMLGTSNNVVLLPRSGDWRATVCALIISAAGGWTDLWTHACHADGCWFCRLGTSQAKTKLRWVASVEIEFLFCLTFSHLSVNNCVLILCVSIRPPRGAPARLLPFYPGTDDQAMLPIGRSNGQHS